MGVTDPAAIRSPSTPCSRSWLTTEISTSAAVRGSSRRRQLWRGHDFGQPKDTPCAFEPQWRPRESLDIPACFCEVSVGRPPPYRQEACTVFLLRQLQRCDASTQSASDDQHVVVLVVGAISLCHVNISPFMVIGEALRVTRRHAVCVLDWWAVIPSAGHRAKPAPCVPITSAMTH